MPGGRPTLYRPQYCKELIDDMAEGKSIEWFAGKISVSKESIYEWTRKHPEFADAFKVGRVKCQQWWENKGMEGLNNSPDKAPLNNAAWIFFMKNRFGWRDRLDVEANNTTTHTGKVEHTHIHLTIQQRKELLEKERLMLEEAEEIETIEQPK